MPQGRALGPDEDRQGKPPWLLLVLSWVAAAWLTTGRFLCSVRVYLLPQLLVPSLALTYSLPVCLPCPRAYVGKSLSSHPCLAAPTSACVTVDEAEPSAGSDRGEKGRRR